MNGNPHGPSDQISEHVKEVSQDDRFGQCLVRGSSWGFLCRLGANGAGKSTAIRLLLGLDDPDSGTTEVLGMNSRTHAMEIRSRVGYMADQPPLYDWMTVEEIGWFAARFYPTGYQKEFEKLTRRFDLQNNQKISTLSKGMKAKVALSLAMAHLPKLLILDEPTSGLDPLVRREFLGSGRAVAAINSVLPIHHLPNDQLV